MCDPVIRALGFSLAFVVSTWPRTATAEPYSFATTAEFLAKCDSPSQPEECRNALMYVEQVVDSSDRPNDTCDGGPEALLKARSNEEFEAWLAERVALVVAWLRQNPAYWNKSYGDGIWAGLKGAYCR